MSLSLFSFILRPFRTYREARKIFKSIHIEPLVGVKDKLSAADLKNGDYALLGNIAFPAETWKLIKHSLIKLDYTYQSGVGRLYKIVDDQSVSVSTITKDEMTALRVAKRFKDST